MSSLHMRAVSQSYFLRYLDYSAYYELLKDWNWEWLVTLTFPQGFHKIGPDIAKARLFQWGSVNFLV